MMSRYLRIGAVLLACCSMPAWANSTINPNEPIQGMPYSSAPIRNNFQSSYNDVTALQNCNRGTTAPSAPNSGYCWLNTSNSALWCYELYNGVLNTWVPIFSLNPTTSAVTFGSCSVAPVGMALGLYAGGSLGLYGGGSLGLY